MSYRLTLILSLVCATLPQACAGGEWRGFRGDGRSVAAEAQLPFEWSIETGDNVAWQVDLPGRGASGPIVVDGRVIVTASSGSRQDRLHVIAFDEKTGRELWQRQFWATGRTLTHPASAVAANTPASDGRRVYAFFSSNDLVALDLDGNLKWVRGLQANHPLAGNDVGQASSPAVCGDAIVVQSEGQGESFVAAFAAADGELRWQHERPRKPSWGTPMPLTHSEGAGDVPAVLVVSQGGYDVFRVTDGERLWGQQIPCDTMPSATVDGDAAYIPAKGVVSVVFHKESQAAKETWRETQAQPGAASPVIYRGEALVINNSGVLAATKVGEAKPAWRLRLGGSFWATPVAAGNHLYCVDSKGKMSVVELGEKGKVVATNDFGQEVMGSPAVSGDALFVRSMSRLWKIAEKSAGVSPAGGG